MSEKQEHKRRYNRRLDYIARFDNWLATEPPMLRIFAWRKWKNRRPIWED